MSDATMIRLAPHDSRTGPGGAPEGSRRILVLDAVRGGAVAGMVLFHLDWDLADFGYVSAPPNLSVAWTALGDGVAATFLLLSGIGLALARPYGLGASLRRLALIAGCAALVTLVTAWLFPQDAITFGILHCIVVTNLVALGLRDRPVWLLLVLSVAALAAPVWLRTGSTEGPVWWWLGLSGTLPQTLDYRPVLPWLGVVLLGLAFGRAVPIRTYPSRADRWPRGFAKVGRHSLVIYLVHQPVMFGILTLINLSGGPATEPSFLQACQTQCQATGAGAEGCHSACLCAAQRADAISSVKPVEAEKIARDCTPSPAHR